MKFNLQIAWLWVLLGFVSGMLQGMFFHRENWLGGYGSFMRRMYRLAHISFFGLGALNLLFFFTVRTISLTGDLVNFAGWGFIIGAVSMPVCCVIMAHRPRLHALFAVPVISLIAAGAITLLEVIQL